MSQAIIVCPNCRRQMAMARPDGAHPVYSLSRPGESEIEGDVIEKVCSCRNRRCRGKVTVYWFETKLFLDRG